MRKLKLFAAIALAVLGMFFVLNYGAIGEISREILNVEDDSVLYKTCIDAKDDTAVSFPPEAMTVAETEQVQIPAASDDNIVPTTISGGLSIKNSTSYIINVKEMLSEGCPIRLKEGKPQILIIHTHSSEAYSPAGLDQYDDSGGNRTQDNNYNVIRIGDELEKLLSDQGLKVIHDRGVYDYPSYTGSYSKCGEAISKYLEENPSISIVIDLHRDALGSDDVTYKTVATETGVCASQLMFVMGSDECGLEHPNWKGNLSLALYLQNAVTAKYASLMRPVSLVGYRYNQHLSSGSLILEVGSNGNTIQEALAAIRLFADAAGPALLKLVE